MKIYGLTDAEVAESKAKYGDNSMTEQKGEPDRQCGALHSGAGGLV